MFDSVIVFTFQAAEHTDYFYDIWHCYGSVCDHAVIVRLFGNWNDETKHLCQHTMHCRRPMLCSLCRHCSLCCCENFLTQMFLHCYICWNNFALMLMI